MRSAILVDIREIIRQLRTGQRDRQISGCVGLSHRTVGRYRQVAERQDWLKGDQPLPSLEAIQAVLEQERGELPSQNQSTVMAHARVIQQLYEAGVEQATVIYDRLVDGYGYRGSYWAVWRYVRRYVREEGRDGFVRIHSGPGEEAQVDFGEVGLMWDPGQQRLQTALSRASLRRRFMTSWSSGWCW